MNDYNQLYRQLADTPLQPWLENLPAAVEQAFADPRHGNMPRWQTVLEQLPRVVASQVVLDAPSITIGGDGDCDDGTRRTLEQLLRQYHPWRKGPFNVHGVEIDTEWRSDWKWQRIAPHIQPLQGRRVLDVGCGSGYHCWRMAGAGAALVIGIEPMMLYVMQYLAIKHFAGDWPVYVLPFALEALPPGLAAFDSVFAMGVLYHRRSPFDHLLALRDCLRPGGELVLETLVIDGGPGEVLVPEGRYAKMRNVWFLPSVPTLESWLRRCGFTEVRTVDVSVTSAEEQRATGWMQFESLADFLDPGNPGLTVEGHPAPRRVVLLAECP